MITFIPVKYVGNLAMLYSYSWQKMHDRIVKFQLLPIAD
jgi:hypothetical protein